MRRGSVVKNLQSVVRYQPWWGTEGVVTTGPGCFAYPDGLEVGSSTWVVVLGQ